MDVLVICGPTAVGKTDVAIRVSEKLNGEIVSCDSMQLYEHMDIGSAKPDAEELARVPHHLIGAVDPREPFSVVKYRELALEAIRDIKARGKLPVICGGTGLYLDALLYELDFASVPENDPSYREELYRIAETEGPEALHRILETLDAGSAARIHPNNIKRTVRAIESARTGSPIADFASERVPNPEIDPVLTGLTRDRAELYGRINMRVDIMLEKGLVDEVRGLMDMGLTDSDISMKGIGYKEVIAYLEGRCGYEEMRDNIMKNTRHYAKRQMTWFKRYEDMKWFLLSGYGAEERTAAEITEWLSRR